MQNKKRILILGADGYLGTKLISLLNENEFFIDKFDKFPQSKNTQLLDIKDTNEVIKIINDKHYDVIVCLVGLLPGSARKKKLYSTNLSAVSYLKKFQTSSHFIFCSSTAIYKNIKFDKELIQEPFEVYGKSKLECEEIIKASTSSYTILRIGTMLSPDRQGGVMKILKRIKNGKLIWLPFKGYVTHPFVGAEDVASAIKYLCTNNINGTFDLIANNRKTLNELAHQLNSKQRIINNRFLNWLSNFIGSDNLPVFGISKWHLNALKYDIPVSKNENMWEYTQLDDMSIVLNKAL